LQGIHPNLFLNLDYWTVVWINIVPKNVMEKMKQQLHIDVTSEQLRKFKAAVKTLGFATMSEYMRAKIRQAITEAEEIEGAS
jgi:hypothetical protein